MRYGVLFLAAGSSVLLFGFLLRAVSFQNLFGHVPPYMGPPQESIILETARMFSFPYVFDTISLATFGISIGFILLGIAVSLRKGKAPARPSIKKRDHLYPYQ